MTPVGLTSRILYPFISRLDTKQLSPPSPPHTARSPPQAPFIQESTFQTECENFSSGTFHRRLIDSFLLQLPIPVARGRIRQVSGSPIWHDSPLRKHVGGSPRTFNDQCQWHFHVFYVRKVLIISPTSSGLQFLSLNIDSQRYSTRTSQMLYDWYGLSSHSANSTMPIFNHIQRGYRTLLHQLVSTLQSPASLKLHDREGSSL